jgi:hypothetical protein
MEVSMIDWYSSYLLSRERQREVIGRAEGRRRFEAAQNTGQARAPGGGPAGRFGASKIRQRIGEVLISLGQMLL